MTDDFDAEQLIYIKIPYAIQPLDRRELFEDPINAALGNREFAKVSGGGAPPGNILTNGTRSIEFCGIDVDATDCDAALE